MGRGKRSDRGEARWSTPVQGTVFRVVKVICGQGRKRFISPSLVAVRKGAGLSS